MLPEGDSNKLHPMWGDFVESIPSPVFDLPSLEYSLINPRRAPLSVWNNSVADKFAFIQNPSLGDRGENIAFLSLAHSIYGFYATYPNNRLFRPDKQVQIKKIADDLLRLYQWNSTGSIEGNFDSYESMININNFLLDFFTQLPNWEEASEVAGAKYRGTYEKVNRRMRENELAMGDELLLNGRPLPQVDSNEVVVMYGPNAFNGVVPKEGGDTTIFLTDGELELRAFIEIFSQKDKPAHLSLRALGVALDPKKALKYSMDRFMAHKINTLVDDLGTASKRMMEWLAQDKRTIEYCIRWQYMCEVIVQRKVEKLGKNASIICKELDLRIGNGGSAALELENYLLNKLLP